jgi:hypothetical protein
MVHRSHLNLLISGLASSLRLAPLHAGFRPDALVMELETTIARSRRSASDATPSVRAALR